MAIVHTAMFSFKPLVPPEEIEGMGRRLLELKDKCVHPRDNKPYIKSAMGGTDTSSEQLQDGITHVFMCEFENAEDREYYLHEDPTYADFCKRFEGIIEKKQVVDFVPGQFTTCAR
ncbi:stress responsive A/B barrel domain protein [Podospora aff. communis PSN243]|uniref:Stress responsive A/B barrel domain protein n=1 Tax=Podospora aff. communis PSN243 TaxID=3040156 RepID=A0AAV9GHF5_9PEZI|nr:stress responsive A/B barrel domain protein [Podospora aff. communis PSN243]